jgi:hypothetical protein
MNSPDPETSPASISEAETLAIVIRRQLRCFFVTDDRDAARLASAHGVQAIDRWALLRVAYRQAWLDADTLWGYAQTLHRQGRGWPRAARDRPSFDKWLSA